ncbi:30S ribosome-binding factor RbfA [Phreatobacter aquaticus]|uniref:Ribosome-binding factor A n=1 Tax=Phreatobacter aquaticus TaxID=2570229 RepID=A0A4D7QG14_9HYPH|nr:30S ribosome-binding factor RbfA [Phreatobacter aquaticus]QCK85631.1 30S ribosome-binding factor RbfA [Phreatobacter aquaticus]
MAKRFDTGTGPSQRQLRVGELMRHALSEVLSRGDIHDPVLAANVVTVPEVKMSPDLKIATCFIMPLGGKDAEAVIQALAQNKRYLRGELAHRTNLKFAPDLRFRVDKSFDEGSRIDRLLDSEVVRRDVGKPAGAADEDDQS